MKIKLLIVDDDVPKINELNSFIKTLPYQFEVSEAKSYQSGLKNIILEHPNLVLLDMSMPTYDSTKSDPRGGRPRPFAGLDILREISRKKLRKIKVIIVTQFSILNQGDKDEKTLDEITKTLEQDFVEYFQGTIYYQYSEEKWKTPLKKLIDIYMKDEGELLANENTNS